MAGLNRKSFDIRLAEMETETEKHVVIWKDIRDYQVPFRGKFKGEMVSNGERKDLNIYNNTAGFSGRTLSAGLNAGVASPSRPWFKLSIADKELRALESVKVYLAAAEEKMYEILAATNFYDSMAVLYHEVGHFGTGAISVAPRKGKVAHFHTYTIGEYNIATNEFQEVDTFYQRLSKTVDYVVRRWAPLVGKDKRDWSNVSLAVKNLWMEGSVDKYVDIIHAIEPNDERIPEMMDAKNKKYRSVYYEIGGDSDVFLNVSGFDDFPLAVVRWSVTGSDPWGTDYPGILALGDSKQLQSEQYIKAKGLKKNVDPPLEAPASMRSSVIQNRSNGVTFRNSFASEGGVKPVYEVKIPLGDIIEDIRDMEGRIRQAFYVDLFQTLTFANRPSDMKASVADVIDKERLLLLGPVLERLNREALGKIIDLVFAEADRAGELPKAPAELKGKNIDVEYISTLSQAQKSVGIGAMERYTGLLGMWAQLDPEVLDNFDFDDAAQLSADILGVNPTSVRSEDQVDAVRAGREQAQNQQAMLDASASAASTAKDLSQANVSEDNLLATLTGG